MIERTQIWQTDLMLVVKFGGAAIIAYVAVPIVVALTGKNTDFKFSASANGSFFVHVLSNWRSGKIAWVIATLSIFYGYVERKLRQRKTKYHQSRITQLEQMRDPQRESSQLMPTGETNKEDKV
ncbi:MAG: hypothetical protein ACYDHM_01560 [Acidiferrobacterales bacterium]